MTHTLGARTSDQGDPTTSFGNQWINTDAFAPAMFNVQNNVYYVRDVPGENPNSSITGWFNDEVTNPPVCPNACQTPKTAPDPPTLSADDRTLARDEAQYSFYPDASRWWERFNLLDTLMRNPTLGVGDSDFEDFMTSMDATPSEALIKVSLKIDSLYQINANDRATLEANTEEIDLLLPQIRLLDSLYLENEVPLLLEQRDSLLELLEIPQSSNQAVIEALESQRQGGLPVISALLVAIQPENTLEANAKEVLKVYMETVLSNEPPTAQHLETLLTIGEMCVFEGGPAVFEAQSIYAGFTNIQLSDADCPGEGSKPTANSHDFDQNLAMEVFPNPANGSLTLRVPAVESAYHLSFIDGRGSLVGKTIVSQPISELNISGLPNGPYLLRLEDLKTGRQTARTLVVQNH